jgi:hypothetical protein
MKYYITIHDTTTHSNAQWVYDGANFNYKRDAGTLEAHEVELFESEQQAEQCLESLKSEGLADAELAVVAEAFFA